MKIQKFILFAAAAMLSGCNDHAGTPEPDADGLTISFSEITACLPSDAETRLWLDNDKQLGKWNYIDEIGVYSNTQGIEKYFTPYRSDDPKATFVGKQMKGSQFYAFFPYADDADIDTNNRSKLHLLLRKEYEGFQNVWAIAKYTNGQQSLLSNNYYQFPLMAKSKDNNFMFKHVCGYLKITIEDTGTFECPLRRITLRGNNGEIIAGDATIDYSTDIPQLSLNPSSANASRTISLEVGVAGEAKTDYYLYFPLPPMVFEKGITVTFEYSYPLSFSNIDPSSAIEVSTNKPIEIKRGMMTAMKPIDGEYLYETGKMPEDVETDGNILDFTNGGRHEWEE